MTKTATGTVYGLIDPRNGKLRYIGQTKQRPATRVRGKYAPRVVAWLAEMRGAGVRPSIVVLRENVPAAGLLAAEREEIARVLLAGGELLNELSTADARELIRQRDEVERAAAEQAAWRELAGVALDMLGGPLPPGDLAEIEIPEASWAYMSRVDRGHRERMNTLIHSDWPLWRDLSLEQEEATRKLQWCVRGAFGDATGTGGDRFVGDLDHNVSAIAVTPHSTRAEVSCHLALMVWYMTAVHPWRHLAELGGMAPDDASFIAWAGQDPGVRDALEFLAARGENALRNIPHRYYSQWEKGPGHTLGAVAATRRAGSRSRGVSPGVSGQAGNAGDSRTRIPVCLALCNDARNSCVSPGSAALQRRVRVLVPRSCFCSG